MTLEALLARLESAGINLRRSAEGLAVSGDLAQLDASMVEALRAHKSQLMELVGEVDGIVATVPGGARKYRCVGRTVPKVASP